MFVCVYEGEGMFYECITFVKEGGENMRGLEGVASLDNDGNFVSCSYTRALACKEFQLIPIISLPPSSRREI